MDDARTTVAVQLYLDELGRHAHEHSAAPVVRELLSQSTRRLHALCGSMLRRSYPRLARPPLNLQPDELLSAVVERMIKALREARPLGVREFFALANRHMRWELNDLARRLDERTPAVAVREASVAAAGEPTGDEASSPAATAGRILAALEELADDQREVFELVRIQGLTHGEVAALLGVTTKTVQRRLNRGLLALTASLGDLVAEQGPAGRDA